MTQENAKQDQTSNPWQDDHRTQTQMLGIDLAGLLKMVCSTPATAVLPAIQISEDTLAGGGDSEADTEAEPHIAVDPNNPSILVAAFQEGRFPTFGGAAGIGFATSPDGGQTWTSGNLPGLTVAAG